MMIEMLQTQPGLYAAIVIGVIFSIVLHELAHGYVAVKQGDDTPIQSGHITMNPVVHMGWLSIAMVAIIGIGWGAMPVNPSRFRSKYGDAIVSVAGPAMNLLLALLLLTIGAILYILHKNGTGNFLIFVNYCRWIGVLNLVLCLFNLFPIPPLDGSRILANFNEGYRHWLASSGQRAFGLFIALIIGINMLERTGFGLFSGSFKLADFYMSVLVSVVR